MPVEVRDYTVLTLESNFVSDEGHALGENRQLKLWHGSVLPTTTARATSEMGHAIFLALSKHTGRDQEF